MSDPASTERRITACYDEDGEPFWRSLTSPPGGSDGLCAMVPDRVIPVIFVPGVMGSNLKTRADNGVRWRLDGPGSAAGWAFRPASFRKQYLRPEAMEVDPGGKRANDTPYSDTHLKTRGWGEVGYMSYGEFLVWLDAKMNDFDAAWNGLGGLRQEMLNYSYAAEEVNESLTANEVALSYRYRFPIWACGYNWLESNRDSAVRLQARIDEAIRFYKDKGHKCEQVIVVTHSMGGLVARYCSEGLGAKDKILGIVHGVMPAIGAAAVYRRMKAGTRNAESWWPPLEWVKGEAASGVLGNDAADMTAVLSGAPGPMQLLPTPEYGNGWLRIQVDGGKPDIHLPRHGDPYTEIYTVRNEWWGLCDDALINPLNDTRDERRRADIMNADWAKYTRMIKKQVKVFHQNLAGEYHSQTCAFYSASKEYLAYGNVIWEGDTAWGERGLSGNRPGRPLDAQPLYPEEELGTTRTVATPLRGDGWKAGIHQTYTIADPDAPGDGTVPERSGIAPTRYANAMLRVETAHEPAFRDCDAARNFTVYALVKIAQGIKHTSLAYE